MTSPGFPETFISLTLQCSVVLLVAMFLTRRANSSAAADRIWAQSHVLVLVLCLIGILLPHFRILQPDKVLMALGQIASGAMFQTFFRTVGVVWIIGVIVLGAATLISLIKTHALVRRGQLECRAGDSTPIWHSDTQQLLNELGAAVVWSPESATPFCWQLHSPVIVLPETIRSFPPLELDAVLRHELAHLKAQHPLRLFLQRLLEIGFWYHPFVWLVSREASLQRELASDLLANRTVSQATTFIRGMIRLADLCSTRTRRLVAGLRFGGTGKSMIQRRVDQILSRDWSSETSLTSSVSIGYRAVLGLTAVLAALIWIPLNPDATGRTILSPWPSVTAAVLHEAGLEVRDYELDRHRLHEHSRERML